MILFFGPAGAGKSVQGQLLAEQHGWPWISTGQLFRDTHDEEILKTIAAGSLIDDEQTNTVLKKALRQYPAGTQVILDGYPRRLAQAKWLVESKPEHNQVVDMAIMIEVPKEEIVARLQSRARHDDTPESIEKRLVTYHEEIDPILAYFSDQHVPICRIPGVGTIDEVHGRIETAVRETLPNPAN